MPGAARGRFIALAVTLSLACGGDGGVTSPGLETGGIDGTVRNGQGAAVRVIDVQGVKFAPAEVTVTAGTTVRWVNPTSQVHTVTPDGHTRFAEAGLAGGQQFEHTFTNPGTYHYYCAPHQVAGMTGVIRVQ